MSRLDDELNSELRKALSREEPPVGFEARLMARLASEPKRETGLARWFKLAMPGVRECAVPDVCRGSSLRTRTAGTG